MNKLTKRVLAFMLMVCMLAAMVPAVVSAETTADPYVIDFEIDTNENLTWQPYEDQDPFTFAGTNFAHAQTNSGHAVWLSAFNAYYENGDINFSFPHTVITSEMAEADETLANHIGKIADASTYKSHYLNANLFGSYKYNNTSSTYDWTGLKIGAASSTYNTSGTGWNAIVLRAPDVGTYDVTLEYSKYAAAGTAAKVFLLPYTAEMKAQVASDPAGWNAEITALITEGTAADSYVGTFSSWITAGSATVPGQIFDMGELSVGIEVDEYLMVISQTAGKYDYLQNITFTPVAEQEIEAEVVERNYSIKGAVTSTVVLNKDGVTDSVEALYDAGTIDWSYLGTNSSDNEVQLQKNYIYNQTVYDRKASGDDDDVYAYEAYKIRSPGEGVYDISATSYKPTAVKTQAWTAVYVAEYTENMDITSVLTDANKIGVLHPESTEGAAGAYVTDAIGSYDFASADKEYVIVLQFDGSYTTWNVNTDYTEKTGDEYMDCFMTNNYYMSAFVIEAQEEALTFVPKAYIGTTAYGTLAAACEAAEAGDTIKLAMDFTGNIDLPAGVSLDLAGNTWTVTSVATTNASETVIDSVGGGNLIAKNIDLYGNNANVLPLQTAANTYTLAEYELTVVADDYEVVGDATRFWFKLDLDDAYLDMIAAGDSGLTIGVNLDWGAAEGLAVTFDNGEGAEAFAAAWAAAAKAGSNVWLYVDITGVENLETLTVTPVLSVNDTDLNNGSLQYTA